MGTSDGVVKLKELNHLDVRRYELSKLGVMNSQKLQPNLPGQTYTETKAPFCSLLSFSFIIIVDFSSIIFCYSFFNEINFHELL